MGVTSRTCRLEMAVGGQWNVQDISHDEIKLVRSIGLLESLKVNNAVGAIKG